MKLDGVCVKYPQMSNTGWFDDELPHAGLCSDRVASWHHDCGPGAKVSSSGAARLHQFPSSSSCDWGKSRDLCFVHIGKSGGASLQNALKHVMQMGLISTFTQVHTRAVGYRDFPCSVSSLTRMKERHSFGDVPATLMDYGEESWSSCSASEHVLLWVRDPVSRLISTWHNLAQKPGRICIIIKEIQERLDVTAHAGSSFDLGTLIRQMASHGNEGLVEAVMKQIPHARAGADFYLHAHREGLAQRNTSRQLPVYFVGRSEFMTDDWARFLAAWSSGAGLNQGELPSLPHTHDSNALFEHVNHRGKISLSQESVAWLRQYYAQDIAVVEQLVLSGWLPSEYLSDIKNPNASYMYWALPKEVYASCSGA